MILTHLPTQIKINGLIFKRVNLLKYKDALKFAKESGKHYRTVTVKPCARLRATKDLYRNPYPTYKNIYLQT